MNRRSYIAVISLVAATLAGHAQDGTQNTHYWTRHWYTAVDFGGVYQQEDTTLFQSSPFPTSGTASFNLGLRGNIALGYNLNRYWAAEFQTGVLWNSMDKINGVSLDQPYPYNTTFNTYTVPLVANILFKIPLNNSLVPYFGLGVGGAASILSYSQASTSMEDCNVTFAYQAEVGLKYRLSRNASLGAAYEFLGTTDPSWHSVLSIAAQPPTDYHFKEKGFYTHSLVISFTWAF